MSGYGELCLGGRPAAIGAGEGARAVGAATPDLRAGPGGGQGVRPTLASNFGGPLPI